ncbi:MAG: hypothetical protein IJZ93_06505 [Clostridia bacterium]|nr:hypothetical protein [Clostridia bacterium]
MFGYVKPQIPELKVRENELYRATYCGLCRTMGKCTGKMSKLTLNYDFVFLVLLRKVLEKRTGEIKMRRCVAHPLKKRPMLEIDDTLKYCARSSIILTRMKLKDNINDSHGFAKLKAKIVGAVSIFFKKTDKELKPLEEKTADCISRLTALERENCDSIDAVACIFGELLANVASFGLEGVDKRVAEEIGYHLGRWIYVIDAIDDMESDIKTQSYNPIVNSFGRELSENDKKLLHSAAMLELEAMSKSIELIDFSAHRDVEGILKNTVYIGMIAQTEKILKLTSC